MYTYCGNNPTNFIDPSGLCKEGYGIGASLSGFGDAIAGRIGRFLTTSPKAHLKNFYSGLYGFGEMLNQSLYDFGYHSNEIYLNEIANKTDYQLGGMIGNLTLDAEIAVVAAKATISLNNTIVEGSKGTRLFQLRNAKTGQTIFRLDKGPVPDKGIKLHYHRQPNTRLHRPYQGGF